MSANNSVTAIVTSPISLTPEERKQLVKNLETVYGKKINLENKVSKRVIGGLKIEIGSQVIDLSLQNELANIKNYLLEN